MNTSEGHDRDVPGAAGASELEEDREEEIDWLREEQSLIARSRRQLQDDLDEANRQLAAARLERSRLTSRRSVRVALVLGGVIRRLRSFVSRRRRPPTPPQVPGRTIAEASDGRTSAAFRSSLAERLRREDAIRLVLIDSVDSVDGSAGEAKAADILAVSTPDLDIRTVRGRPVTIAIIGSDWREWLGRPWLDDFDIVATSDPASRDAILANHAKAPVLVADPLSGARDLVSDWLAARRIGIAVGIPRWDEAHAWGDLHFARALQRQFERHGHPTRVHIKPEWPDEVSARDDVSLHLFGLSARTRLAGQLNLLWVISHPDKVSDEIVGAYDRIYVASDLFAAQVAGRTSVPVSPLHQATDPERFHPDRTGPRHEVLFVGNSRGTRRDILADLTPTTLGLAVYGRDWVPDLLDPAYLYGEHVPNEDLHRFYSSADVVLNDHWADMRATGFFSNRLYDALASGACVVSDAIVGIEDEFDGAVTTYADAGHLRLSIRRLLMDSDRRKALADRGRAAVLERHTFEIRATRILADIDQDLSSAPG